MGRARSVCKFLVELLSLVTLFAVCLVLFECEKRGVSYKRGFFCDDNSIRLPYKPGTVPSYALIIIAGLLPVMIVSQYSNWPQVISNLWLLC